MLREYEWYYKDRPHTPDFLKFDVLVTTYDTLIGDFDVISQIPFRVAVVDEAHRLRNQKGKLLECMREISARGTMHYGYQSRVLMSGTPLQNDLTVRLYPQCTLGFWFDKSLTSFVACRSYGRCSISSSPLDSRTLMISLSSLAIWPTRNRWSRFNA